MAFIKFNNTFKLIPEGETIFKITNALYNDVSKAVELHLQTKDGQTHKEYFNLNNADGSYNKGQENRLIAFAANCGLDTNNGGIDHEDFIGCYIGAVVRHDEWNGKTKVKLEKYTPVDGFVGEAAVDDSEPFAEYEDDMDFLDEL